MHEDVGNRRWHCGTPSLNIPKRPGCHVEEESGLDPVAAIEQGIRYYIDKADWNTDDVMPDVFEMRDKGHIWEPISLPHGTLIRMKYKGEHHYAKVVGDQVIYDGKPTTPSKLANAIAGSNRNAWHDLWVKRPDDEGWIKADVLRR